MNRCMDTLRKVPCAASCTVLSYLSSAYKLLNTREDGVVPDMKKTLACSEWEAVQLLTSIRSRRDYR